MTTPLTERQKTILNFISTYVANSGYPPTLREIAREFRIKGLHAVRRHLGALERKGYLIRGSGARAIELPNRPQIDSIPVLGEIAAGRPILAEENILGTIALDRSLVQGGSFYLLKVKGDSMVGAGILDGDYVLVRVQSHAENGEIVVALVEDEATVKRFNQRGKTVTLQPENPNHEPIVINKEDNFRVLGNVMGVIRLPGLFV